jgi:hypothetical protein
LRKVWIEGAIAAIGFLALVTSAPAQEPPHEVSQQESRVGIETITVQAQRERETLERRVRAFVSAIAVQPFGDSLSRWEKPTTICSQVAGLPRDDGKFILARLSRIAQSAGAPLGPEHCNFNVIVTEKPDELIKALEMEHPQMYTNGYGTIIRKFESVNSPIRVWCNAELYDAYGIKLTTGNAMVQGFAD